MIIMSLFRKHPFLELNMGLVKENFVIVKRTDLKLWEERGFQKIQKYPIFHYRPNPMESIMLGKPLTIQEFTPEMLIGSKIIDYCNYLGTYGMGGPGFFGLKLCGEFGIRWLVYCIWSAGEHILLDDRVIACYPDFIRKYHPWIEEGDFAYELTSKNLKKILYNKVIADIEVQEHALKIQLSGGHILETFRKSDKFPEQGGTRKKRVSYESGVMADYWLVIYDETHLMV